MFIRVDSAIKSDSKNVINMTPIKNAPHSFLVNNTGALKGTVSFKCRVTGHMTRVWEQDSCIVGQN